MKSIMIIDIFPCARTAVEKFFHTMNNCDAITLAPMSCISTSSINNLNREEKSKTPKTGNNTVIVNIIPMRMIKI